MRTYTTTDNAGRRLLITTCRRRALRCAITFDGGVTDDQGKVVLAP